MSDLPSKMRDHVCFVIGPVGKERSEDRKHSDLLLNTVIRPVLEDEEFKYRVKRSDEDADPTSIANSIIRDLLNSDLVVADLTNLNANAFYELAFRHWVNKPTIHLAKIDTELAFVNAGQRTIFVDLSDWNSIKCAKTRLASAARVVQEPGYKVSNPITQALANMTAADIENLVEQLAPREFARFRTWFETFNAEQFDTARNEKLCKIDEH